ncbi:tetratricopeptide repeat protein [Marinobacter halotolerans]|uniref:tetratricopeptide repeat protein n=1 Tax=Marinobacter halotolerans TaxID=1569211 RepID=UPI0012489FE0|nr:hypothetical protein [Marinobacter halotolerans]
MSTTVAPTDPERLEDLVQAQVQRARSTGDPRFLGYAEGLLQQWQGKPTARLKVLQATIDQSNHRFDVARERLTDIIRNGDNGRQSLQARLMLANIHLVQGRYDAAADHCAQLRQQMPGLIAASCQAQTMARTGQPETAYQQLQELVTQTRHSGRTESAWAEGTLGDIAAQLGDPAAESHWRSVLAADPDDLYTRAQLAEWYLNQSALKQTLALTEGYESVDSLAVIRAIALKAAGNSDAERLARVIEERFQEAQWRGNLLHKRDFARFQLDVVGNSSAALKSAAANWQGQREPADTRLFLRAANAANADAKIQTLRTWLAENNQRDARYPETRP